MRKLTPREKKRLSYERDGRNAYGENDKASRKAIPLRKMLAARAVRRTTRGFLGSESVATSDTELEQAEGRIAATTRKTLAEWRKIPDVPLGEYLARKRRRRA